MSTRAIAAGIGLCMIALKAAYSGTLVASLTGKYNAVKLRQDFMDKYLKFYVQNISPVTVLLKFRCAPWQAILNKALISVGVNNFPKVLQSIQDLL